MKKKLKKKLPPNIFMYKTKKMYCLNTLVEGSGLVAVTNWSTFPSATDILTLDHMTIFDFFWESSESLELFYAREWVAKRTEKTSVPQIFFDTRDIIS